MAIATTAIFAAIADASVASVAAAVAAVGLDTSIVGAVTGNKTLTSIGAVLGAAGGVTSLAASGVDALFSGTSIASDTLTPSADAASTVSGSIIPNPDPTPTINAAPDVTPSAAPTGSILQQPMVPNDSFTGLPVQTDPITGLPGAPTPNGIANDAMNAAQGPYPGASFSTQDMSPSSIAQQIGQKATAGSGNLMQWFNGLSPVAQYGVVQAVGSGMGGLSGAYTAQQKIALDQLVNSENWQKYNTAYNNVNSPTTITFGAPTAPKAQNLLTPSQPQQPVVSTTGLISTPGGAA